MPTDERQTPNSHREEWKAFSLSFAAHAAFLLFAFFFVRPQAPDRVAPQERPHLVELQIEPVPVLAPEGGAPTGEAQAPRTAAPPAERPRPEPRRTPPARPATPTPVELPTPTRPPPTRPQTTRPTPAPPPPVRRDPEAQVRPPAPPPATPDERADPAPAGSPTQGTTENGGVSATGAPGSGGSQDGGGRGGIGGGSGVAYGGLGNRGIRCRTPAFPGYSGTVSYSVTFAPNGRYVSSRAVRRAGNTQVNSAAGNAVSSCRAEPLPEDADQVNQTGSVTFTFTLR